MLRTTSKIKGKQMNKVNTQMSKPAESLKNKIKLNAKKFGSLYGFSAREIEEIYKECYHELAVGAA